MAEKFFSVRKGEVFLYKGEPRNYYLVAEIRAPEVTLVDAFGVESEAEGRLNEVGISLARIGGVEIETGMCQRLNFSELPLFFGPKFRTLIRQRNLNHL